MAVKLVAKRFRVANKLHRTATVNYPQSNKPPTSGQIWPRGLMLIRCLVPIIVILLVTK